MKSKEMIPSEVPLSEEFLILDEEYYWDAPEAHKKTLAAVKEQEARGIKYNEDE